MQDPNTAAAANMASGFMSMGEGLMRGKQFKSELQTADITRKLAKEQLEQQGLSTRQAKKAEFLQSFNPVPGASDSFAKTLRAQTVSAPAPTAPETPGSFPAMGAVMNVMSGIPAYISRPSLPQDAPMAPSRAPAFSDEDVKAGTDAFSSASFDEMPPEAQQHIIDEYRTKAPEGVTVSPAEAAMAYRSQQRLMLPQVSLATSGLVPISGTRKTAEGGEITYERPLGEGGEGGGGLTRKEALALAPELTGKAASSQAAMDAKSIKSDAEQVISLAEQARTDPSYKTVSDFALLKAFMYSINPRMRQQPQQKELWPRSVPEHLKDAVTHAITGKSLSQSERDEMARLAKMNIEAAEKQANEVAEPYATLGKNLGLPQNLLPHVGLPPKTVAPSVRETGRAGTEVPGTSGNESSARGGEPIFASVEAANAANLPKGTVVRIPDRTGRLVRHRND